MNIFLLAAFGFVDIEALALWKNWLRLKYIATSAAMLALFFWLWMSTGMSGTSFWFGLGILISLVGDVLMMFSIDTFIIGGLAAFLLAYLVYILGFNFPLPLVSAWGVVLAVIIGIGGARIIRRILAGLAANGQGRMRMPIILYNLVILLTLLSAMMKLNDPTWGPGASLLVSLGAFLLYISDIILAWDKIVSPIQHGRSYNNAARHFGQIILIVGVVRQFGR